MLTFIRDVLTEDSYSASFALSCQIRLSKKFNVFFNILFPETFLHPLLIHGSYNGIALHKILSIALIYTHAFTKAIKAWYIRQFLKRNSNIADFLRLRCVIQFIANNCSNNIFLLFWIC